MLRGLHTRAPSFPAAHARVSTPQARKGLSGGRRSPPTVAGREGTRKGERQPRTLLEPAQACLLPQVPLSPTRGLGKVLHLPRVSPLPAGKDRPPPKDLTVTRPVESTVPERGLITHEMGKRQEVLQKTHSRRREGLIPQSKFTRKPPPHADAWAGPAGACPMSTCHRTRDKGQIPSATLIKDLKN